MATENKTLRSALKPLIYDLFRKRLIPKKNEFVKCYIDPKILMYSSSSLEFIIIMMIAQVHRNRPLTINTICIFNTFNKYLYWLFSILLEIFVLVLINTFSPTNTFSHQYFFMNHIFSSNSLNMKILVLKLTF